ncbi:MAG: class I SAM-dependent methyltransferase [Planctomycetes bacterium]|nr:class I SAM-dependent methyltransferase [Planctomycetota bacterium]
MTADDPFRRLDYRRFVAWGPRIRRELPFLRRTFGAPGKRPLLDIACGTGEHAHALGEEGYPVVGLDISRSMLEKAREAYPALALVAADMASMPFASPRVFGGALCLGNSLAALDADARYQALFATLRRVLAEGAPLLLQILNYRRILEQGIRHLPLNFRPGPESEIVYLRILDPIDARRIRFEVITLERRPPAGESRIAQVTSRVMRPLQDEELRGFLAGAGFERIDFFGDYEGADYRPLESADVIAVAR